MYDNLINLTSERATMQEIEDHALALSKDIKHKAASTWQKSQQSIDNQRNRKNIYTLA
jgi:hypothetical protein